MASRDDVVPGSQRSEGRGGPRPLGAPAVKMRCGRMAAVCLRGVRTEVDMAEECGFTRAVLMRADQRCGWRRAGDPGVAHPTCPTVPRLSQRTCPLVTLS
jgi:hypothetical protein